MSIILTKPDDQLAQLKNTLPNEYPCIRCKHTGRVYQILLEATVLDPHMEVLVVKDYYGIWCIPKYLADDPKEFHKVDD